MTNEPPGTRLNGSGAPVYAVDAAKAAFDTRSPKVLASLDFDSLVDADDSPEYHRLGFECELISVEARVAATTESAEITVDVQPPSRCTAVLHFCDADLALVSRIRGSHFSFDPVAHGLVRLSFEGRPNDPIVYTDWFRV